MSEFTPDYSSPAATIASYEVWAEKMRKAAREASDEKNRQRYLDLAQDAEETAEDLRNAVA